MGTTGGFKVQDPAQLGHFLAEHHWAAPVTSLASLAVKNKEEKLYKSISEHKAPTIM